MKSNEDLELLSPSNETSSVQERKLKRLKKVKTIAEDHSQFEALDFDLSDGRAIEDQSGAGFGFDSSDEENELSSGFNEFSIEENESGSAAKRTLDFDSMNEQVDGDIEDQRQEAEIRDLEKKRPSFDELGSEKMKKKKKVKGVEDEDMPMLPEKRTAKVLRNISLVFRLKMTI